MTVKPTTYSPASGGRPMHIRTYRASADPAQPVLLTWNRVPEGTWRVSEINSAIPLTTAEYHTVHAAWKQSLRDASVPEDDDRWTWAPRWTWSRTFPAGSEADVERLVEEWVASHTA